MKPLERQIESGELDSVDVIASGYEWMCPECNHFNTEAGIRDEVECEECHTHFETNGAEHAYD